MNKEILQIIMAGIGTLGFSIYFRVSEKNVAASTIGGAVGFAFYLLIFKLTKSLFFANFAAAFLIYLYSELCARILKAPSNVFLVPGIITKSGFPKRDTSFTYLTCTPFDDSSALKSVKLDICGSFITAISTSTSSVLS